MRKGIGVLCILLVMLLAACGQDNTQGSYQAQLYFLNQEGTGLVQESRTISLPDGSNLIRQVLEELMNGPTEPSAKRCLPERTKVLSLDTTSLDGKVIVNFSREFTFENPVDLVLAQASIVSTLTNIPNVTSVQVLREGEALYGGQSGPVGGTEIVYDPDAESDTKYVNLYFMDETASKLVPEVRKITLTQKETTEMTVVKELIKGPTGSRLLRTVPQETKILSVETKEGVCFVNLSQEFKTKHSGGTGEEALTIYSIVNSLTELPGVNRVQFLIDGQKEESYIQMIFNEPFAREERYMM